MARPIHFVPALAVWQASQAAAERGNGGTNMIVVSVLYPATASRFDEEYYMQTHIPLVTARWKDMGLAGAEVLRGTPGPDGSTPPYRLIALLRFTSMQDFKAAAAAHGSEIFADIAKFTDGTPVLQFNETSG